MSQNRLVILFYDKAASGYSDQNVNVGELIIDSSAGKGYAFIKTKDDKIVPIKGAGYDDLLNFIKNTTAINVEPTNLNSFHLDKVKAPDPSAPVGVLKVRVPSGNGTEFKELAIMTNSDNCLIFTGDTTQDGQPVTKTVKEFFKEFTEYKNSSGASSQDHEKRITGLEDNIKDRQIDKVLYYKKFNSNEVADLLFKVTPKNTPKEKFKNEFISTVVLGTDDGTSINKHFLGLTVDNVDNTYTPDNFYVRDLGNIVNLSVKYYFRDGSIYIRPTQTDGEFILRDVSTNAGTFKAFDGTVSILSFASSGLTPANEIRPLGEAKNEESTSFVISQPSHGMTGLVPAYYDPTTKMWKKATLENRATALLAKIDNNFLYAYTAGHIKVPEGITLTSDTVYYLSQTNAGEMQSEKPKYIYQELGYCYAKKGVLWFAINIGTPIELAPYAIKDFATKTEMHQRVRYVESIDSIQNISEPEGTVIIVADLNNWHTRKVEATSRGDNPKQLQNGLFANISASDKKIMDLLETKFDKGTSTLFSKYPNAGAIIDVLEKKMTVPDSFQGGFNTLLNMINGKLNISDLSQNMTNSSPTTAPSASVFKQLVDLVQSMAEGGTGAVVPQDNTPVHIEEGTLTKGSTTITSQSHVLYNPMIYVEGQAIPRSEYSFVASTGAITLKSPYSTTNDVKYTLIDVFPTDIRFIADTAGAVAAAPYSSSLKEGDVIRILGRTTKYDGGGHLRILQSNRGLDAIAIGNKFLNKVPYSDGMELKAMIDTKLPTDTFNSYKSTNDNAVNSKLPTSTFNEYKSANDNAVSSKLPSATFDNHIAKNENIFNGTKGNMSNWHFPLSWQPHEREKVINLTSNNAIADNGLFVQINLLEPDGESGYCSFAAKVEKVSNNNYNITITPYINGQKYVAVSNAMKANMSVFARIS